MSKRTMRFLALFAVLALLAVALSGVQAQDKARVTWFVGLGTGTNPHQIEAQEAVVAAFNASQSEVELVVNIAPDYETARDIMTTMMSSGEAPDIIGPVGFDGSNQFAGNWLDIQPLVDASGYDLTQFPEAAVNFYRTDEGLVGLPLATFPSFIVYNVDLFDEAGLAYPPTEHGAPYVDAEGNEHEWNMDTLAQLAATLSVDANGNDASSADFDAENIVQWGYYHQDKELREEMSMFGAGSFYDAATGSAVLPDQWRTEAQWYYDAMWTNHWAPTEIHIQSELLTDKFESGNIGMIHWHTWGLPGLEGAPFTWNIAATPNYNGTITAPLHADTFRVMKTTENPEATFAALSYLVGEGSLPLLAVYGGMPAREGDQEAFFATLDETFPWGVNWEVAQAGLNYPDIPSHEGWQPNYGKSRDVMAAFYSKLHSTPDLDIDAELDQFIVDMQAVFDEVQ